MSKTVHITTEILPSRELHVKLPDDTPLGPARVTVVISPETTQPVMTFGELLNSEFFAMWRDRTDISDSVSFARQLRTKAWSRDSDGTH